MEHGTRAALRWEYQPGSTLALWVGDQLTAGYDFSTTRHKAHCFPLRTTGGIDLTASEPADHPWHRGLWFSWKFLAGDNYWEEREDDIGRTELRSEQVEVGSDSAVARTSYDYSPEGAPAVLTERRRVEILAPDASGLYRIDWEHRFNVAGGRGSVEIAALPISAYSWGGYAGLSWRAARSMTEFRALDSEGRHDGDVDGARSRWLDLSGQADGGWNRSAGIAMFDHPANPRHPSVWRCIMEPGFGWANPTLVVQDPYDLAPGEELCLRYRALIHDGWGADLDLDAEFDAYVARTADVAA